MWWCRDIETVGTEPICAFFNVGCSKAFVGYEQVEKDVGRDEVPR